MNGSKPILLVEDDVADAFFLQWAFRSAGLLHPVYVAGTAHHAINYLVGTGPFSNRCYFPLPLAIVLNLHAPALADLMVRDCIRNTRDLADLPLITLASMPAPEIPIHSKQTFRFWKPTDPDSFLALAKSIAAILVNQNDTSRPNAQAA